MGRGGTSVWIAWSGSWAARMVRRSRGASHDWRELYDEYQRRGVPAGAEIPAS